MSEQHHLTISSQGDVTVVEFAARKILEELTIREIEDELMGLVEGKDGVKIVLNFTNVGHFSSAALGVLNKLYECCKQQNGKMILTGISPRIMDVFVITNLNKRFTFSNNVAEALSELS